MTSGVGNAAALTFSGPPAGATAVSRPRHEVVAGEPPQDRRWMRPGWPLAAMLVPYPLWWALGTTDLALVALSIPMAVWLLKRTTVLAPRAFGWWLLFLVWVLGGVVLLQVDALGTVSDTHSTRYLTWLYRLLMYLAATITTLYVVNARRELSLVRVSRIVGALFITTVAGGLLGVLAPYFQFRSAMELCLKLAGALLNAPSLAALANQPFVHSLIHPAASQIQTVLGFTSPRPSAPYEYTNTWGLLFALTLPFFVHAWMGKSAQWRRWLAPLILLTATVPAVYSVDRGMWAAVVAMLLFLSVRAMVMGRPGLMISVLAGAAVVAIVVAASPLAGIIQARFSNSGSVEGRSNLGSLAIRSVTASAPLVGLGSTRNVQGNFHSIAGGATANCPQCSPPALGTQGQLWLVTFSQGWPGILFFLLFFGRALFTGVRIRAPGATAATCVLVAGLVTLPVYDSIGVGLVVEMVAVAVIWREVVSVEGTAALPDTASYFGPLRRQLPVVVVCTLLGLASGVAWQQVRGVPVMATETLLLSNSPRYPLAIDGPMTIDTLARKVHSAAVTGAVARATGWSSSEIDKRLAVTAAPNTRVLRLSVTGDRARAVAGVTAASDSFLQRRFGQLANRQAHQVRILQAQAASLDGQLRVVNRTLNKLERTGAYTYSDTRELRRERTELLTQITQVNSTLSQVLGGTISAGEQMRPTKVSALTDVRTVTLTSGLLVGFLVGCLIAMWRERRGRRLMTAQDVVSATGLPVIAELPRGSAAGRRRLRWARRRRSESAGDPEPPECDQARLALDLYGVDTLMPASPGEGSLATRLGKTGSPPFRAPYYETPRTAIVVSDSCRAADLAAVRRVLERSGTMVVGVVLWSRSVARGKRRRSGSSRGNRGALAGQQELRPSWRG